MKLFEDFLCYCEDENEEISEEIKTLLADYFDLPNRTIELAQYEANWIGENLSEGLQLEILGKVLIANKGEI